MEREAISVDIAARSAFWILSQPVRGADGTRSAKTSVAHRSDVRSAAASSSETWTGDRRSRTLTLLSTDLERPVDGPSAFAAKRSETALGCDPSRTTRFWTNRTDCAAFCERATNCGVAPASTSPRYTATIAAVSTEFFVLSSLKTYYPILSLPDRLSVERFTLSFCCCNARSFANFLSTIFWIISFGTFN